MTRRRITRKAANGMLTPPQFALRVDSSVRELHRLHSDGMFIAKEGGGVGRGKQRLYGEEQVAEFLRAYTSSDVAAAEQIVLTTQKKKETVSRLHSVPFTGEQARIGFLAFDAGKNIRHLVVEEGFHPDTAGAIATSWAEVTDGFLVSKATLDTIHRFPLSGPVPIRNENDLIEVLRLSAEENSCTSCRKNIRHFCKSCVSKAIFETRMQEREKARPSELIEPAEASNGVG